MQITLFFLLMIKSSLTSQHYDELFQDYKKSGKIIESSQKDFLDFKKYFEYVLVYFYSPSCSACQKFKDSFASTVEELSHIKSDLPILQFNCEDK